MVRPWGGNDFWPDSVLSSENEFRVKLVELIYFALMSIPTSSDPSPLPQMVNRDVPGNSGRHQSKISTQRV